MRAHDAAFSTKGFFAYVRMTLRISIEAFASSAPLLARLIERVELIFTILYVLGRRVLGKCLKHTYLIV